MRETEMRIGCLSNGGEEFNNSCRLIKGCAAKFKLSYEQLSQATTMPHSQAFNLPFKWDHKNLL